VTSDAHRKTVLIVDDDRDIRLFVSGLMKSSGYRTLSAQDRQHGLDKARTEQPDCIILNCIMGDEDGMSFYKTLRTQTDLKHIPVVMVSPVSREVIGQHWVLRQGSVAGPEAYVQSPPEAGSLVHAVGELIAQQRTRHPEKEK